MLVFRTYFCDCVDGSLPNYFAVKSCTSFSFKSASSPILLVPTYQTAWYQNPGAHNVMSSVLTGLPVKLIHLEDSYFHYHPVIHKNQYACSFSQSGQPATVRLCHGYWRCIWPTGSVVTYTSARETPLPYFLVDKICI